MALALSLKCIFTFEHILFNLSFLGTTLETLIVRSSTTKPFAKSAMDFTILWLQFYNSLVPTWSIKWHGLSSLMHGFE